MYAHGTVKATKGLLERMRAGCEVETECQAAARHEATVAASRRDGAMLQDRRGTRQRMRRPIRVLFVL